MRYRGLAVACLALPAVARADAAVGTGTEVARPRPFEVGAFVGVDLLPHDIELGNSWASDQVPGSAPTVGGRFLWWYFYSLADDHAIGVGLGVEGEAHVAMSSTSAEPMAGRGSYASPVLGLGAHVLLALRTGTPVTPHLLVGAGANTLFTSSPYASDDIDPVAYWGLGASWKVGRRMTLRLDVRHGVEAGRMGDLTSTFAAELGISTTLGSDRMTVPYEPPVADEHDPSHAHEPPPPPPPPPDRDADGIPDEADTCPDAAEDKDGFQDDDGCPDPDNDGDGLADAADKCPDEAETVNGFEDDDGCPDQLPAALAALEGPAAVGFATGKPRLTDAAKKALDRIASGLRKFPAVRLRVEGHAGKGVTVDLARRRAEAVKWYLVDAGIAADRVDTASPAADADAARIELHLVTKP